MRILVDLDEVIELGVTFEQYYLLSLLYFKRLDLLIQYTDHYGEFKVSDVETLKRKELVDFKEFKGDISSVSITDKGKTFVHEFEGVVKTDILDSFKAKKKVVEESPEIDKFCEEQYLKFPEKIKTGGYLVRSGLTAFKVKLKKFISLNKSYSNEVVSKAFDLYVQEKRKTGWTYMKTASYFVSKDNESVLASYCESALLSPDKPKEIYGSTFK